jgi:hypothetical protein
VHCPSAIETIIGRLEEGPRGELDSLYRSCMWGPTCLHLELSDTLRATRHEVEEDTVVGAVLAGLPEAYDTSEEILEASEEVLELATVCTASANRSTA